MMKMEYEPKDEDYVQGYWYYRPDNNFPPPAIFHLDESFSDCKLCLGGVPESSGISNYQQDKIIRSWSEILPSLESVEFLWVAPKVDQNLFNAISRMPNLRGLWIKHSSIKYVEASILHGLEFLWLGSSPSLSSIQQFANINRLRWLETENLKLISDFSPLSSLEELVGLGVHGSMWTTQRVDSLCPLTNLTKLRYLSLTNTRVTDKSLKPLHHLKNLETLNIAKWWPKVEVDALLAVNPRLKQNKST